MDHNSKRRTDYNIRNNTARKRGGGKGGGQSWGNYSTINIKRKEVNRESERASEISRRRSMIVWFLSFFLRNLQFTIYSINTTNIQYKHNSINTITVLQCKYYYSINTAIVQMPSQHKYGITL